MPSKSSARCSDANEFASLDEANEILGLIMRHWNTIVATPPHQKHRLVEPRPHFGVPIVSRLELPVSE